MLNKYLRYQFQSEVKSEMNTAFYLSTTRQTNSQIHTHTYINEQGFPPLQQTHWIQKWVSQANIYTTVNAE